MYLFKDVCQLRQLCCVGWKAESSKLKKMCEETTASNFEPLPQNLLGQTDENNENVSKLSLVGDCTSNLCPQEAGVLISKTRHSVQLKKRSSTSFGGVIETEGKCVLFGDRVWKQTLDNAWPTERGTCGDGHGVVTLFTGRVRVRRLREVFGPLFPSSNLMQLPLFQNTRGRLCLHTPSRLFVRLARLP